MDDGFSAAFGPQADSGGLGSFGTVNIANPRRRISTKWFLQHIGDCTYRQPRMFKRKAFGKLTFSRSHRVICTDVMNDVPTFAIES